MRNHRRLMPLNEWHTILGPEFLKEGELIRFWYPTINRFGIKFELVERLIAVESVADFRDAGVPSWAIKRRPLVRRGVWLVSGVDQHLNAERSFWWEAMYHPKVRSASNQLPALAPLGPPDIKHHPYPLPALRLGFHEPSEAELSVIDWIDRAYNPRKRDRLLLKKTVLELEETVLSQVDRLVLSAFPVPRTK